MNILGIETSCDETALAILEFKNSKIKILQSLIASQIKIHAPFGGVVPHLAAREHDKNLPILFKKIKYKFDKITVTTGPGLSPCLWRGINFAKTLGKPIIPVNHLAGHIYANWPFDFPALALIVSGGHTQLVFLKKHQDYLILGQTRDDAAGEAFDKIAKLLDLGYPGGPIIEKMAQSGNPKKYDLPRPMLNSGDYDFSFSGLKTAVLYLTKKQKINKPDLCASFQQAVIDVLKRKLETAILEYKPKSILLGGGVVCNQALRDQVPHTHAPEKKNCVDNAVMIAIAGYFNKKIVSPDSLLEAKPNLMLE